ncbi:MAG: glycoside hydrolase family 31 protein, partial [Myxococcota bacterium]|nr:glycoside hydrolase family 31 protein [Myxococcota bacterium]
MTPASEIVLSHDDDGAQGQICTDALAITIAREGMRVSVRDRDGRVLLEDASAEGMTRPDRVLRVTPRDEAFLGLGERTGPLDARGRRVTMWNTDAYDSALGGFPPDADPLYLSIPFFVGVRGDVAYGLFTDVAHRLEFDLAASDPDRYEIRSAGPELDQWVIAGPTPRDVVRRYTALTGRTPIPPRWSLGYHQSRWGYPDAARIDQLAGELRRRELPSDALWLDIQHMREFRTFTFDPVRFADPEGLAARLDAQGFHLVVIADPGLKEDPGWRVYDRAVGDALVLRDTDGAPYTDATWAGSSVFLDFTLPAARTFWAEQIAALGARGIGGIWLDVNEPTTFPESGGETTVPSHLAIDGDGIATTMAEGHNVYALHQARATVDGLRAAFPERRPFVLCRAGYAGIQRSAAVWTGDAPSTWWSLRQVLPMLLGMGLSGVPFVGSDVGGYSGRPSPELFARWMALGAISPFFRGHVTNGVPDQEPWSFGVEVEDISRARMRERYALMPYLYSLWDEHARDGAPPLRAMAFEHFEDASLRRIDDQAMLGPWLLVAPLLDEGATTRAVRLPAGRWYELDSGAIWEGPATIEVNATLAALPIFVREGAILPRTDGDVAHTGELRGDAPRIDLYPADRETRFVLYEDAGEGYGAHARTTLALARTAAGARLAFAPR